MCVRVSLCDGYVYSKLMGCVPTFFYCALILSCCAAAAVADAVKLALMACLLTYSTLVALLVVAADLAERLPLRAFVER